MGPRMERKDVLPTKSVFPEWPPECPVCVLHLNTVQWIKSINIRNLANIYTLAFPLINRSVTGATLTHACSSRLVISDVRKLNTSELSASAYLLLCNLMRMKHYWPRVDSGSKSFHLTHLTYQVSPYPPNLAGLTTAWRARCMSVRAREYVCMLKVCCTVHASISFGI